MRALGKQSERMQKLADFGVRVAMTKHRQGKSRLGDEQVAAHQLEWRASWINARIRARMSGVFVIAGGDHAQAIDLDRNLRRTEDMPGGVQRDFRSGKADAFA